MIATAASPVAVSTVCSARGTVEIGFIAARTRSTSPVVMPPSVPPERPVTRRIEPSRLTISSCACEPRSRASSKPSPSSTPLIAWMPISAAASRESRRRSPCTWLPSPGGRPQATHLDDAAEGVAGLLGRPRSRRSSRPRSRDRSSAPRTRRRCLRSPGFGSTPAGVCTVPMRDHVAEHLDAEALLQERLGHRAERDPGGGLARARAFENRTGVGDVVLLHADEVGVAGAGTGERGVAGLLRPARPHRPGRPTSPSSTWAIRCCRCAPRPGRPSSGRAARRR